SRHQATQQYGAILPIELTSAEIRNSKAYQEYYACAMGEAAPKPKASARKKKGDSQLPTEWFRYRAGKDGDEDNDEDDDDDDEEEEPAKDDEENKETGKG
nr:hypothetical protein [Tanacetum cinerariifolium]